MLKDVIKKKGANNNCCYACQVFYSSPAHMKFTMIVTVQDNYICSLLLQEIFPADTVFKRKKILNVYMVLKANGLRPTLSPTVMTPGLRFLLMHGEYVHNVNNPNQPKCCLNQTNMRLWNQAVHYPPTIHSHNLLASWFPVTNEVLC